MYQVDGTLTAKRRKNYLRIEKPILQDKKRLRGEGDKSATNLGGQKLERRTARWTARGIKGPL